MNKSVNIATLVTAFSSEKAVQLTDRQPRSNRLRNTENIYSSRQLTCVSGSSEPRLVAPLFTTSANLSMVFEADWAAAASFS